MGDYQSLSEAYNNFAAIRNYPAEGVEFEEWDTLADDKLVLWRDKLQTQGKVVFGLLATLKPNKSDVLNHTTYRDTKRGFSHDTRQIKKILNTRNIQFTLD